MGHFVAHIRRNNVWETYDDIFPGKIQKNPKTVDAVQLVYVMSEEQDEDDYQIEIPMN